MVIKGELFDIKEDGTAIIHAKIDLDKAIKHKVKAVNVEFIDSRPLSDEQRRMCYALFREIAEHIGDTPESVKHTLKMQFQTSLLETLEDRLFSLSNAPMSVVAQFQKYLIEFMLEWNVPTKVPLYEYADDIQHYIFMCLVNKKCAVCGKKAELHHCTGSTVGMGRNRQEISHLGAEALPLCREHHTEIHTTGQKSFCDKYHFDGGVSVDETIAKIYRLKI